jgi:two-component system LytT family sensor kinase
MKLAFILLQNLAFFLVVAYLFSKSPAFRPLVRLAEDPLGQRQKLLLYFIFSAISIAGSYFGLPIEGGEANTRAIGAVLAGLIGGPVLGTAVGFTSGLHSYTLGGLTALSSGLSLPLEGLLGGLVHTYLVKRGQAAKVLNPGIALGTTMVAEALQMLVILALARPFDEALSLVRVIALPMILANGAGSALFLSLLRDLKGSRDKVGAKFSAQALSIADQLLGLLSQGFNQQTAQQMAEIIRRETKVGAVGITDREKILAFSGIGNDHHRPGIPIAAEQTKAAIRENRVIYADGKKDPYQCALSDNCPLGSALAVPLRRDQEVIGVIKLYEPRYQLFLNLNRSLGEGLAALLSHQLLRSSYEEQKNLLVQSELKLIQAQVNPHFLFNTLNTIIAVIRTDPEKARDLLRHLSNFFRKNLKRSGDLATLAEELDHVHSYLEIQEARFGDRMSVAVEVDQSLLGLVMPTFTLQPIIENSIKHGIAEIIGAGKIHIRARREHDLAVIEIEDNAGTYQVTADESGLGMGIVDKRIKNQYGEPYGVRIEYSPGEWTRVSIRLPIPQGERT